MKHYIALGIYGSALAAAAIAVTGIASAAPTGPSDVDQTVRTLQASGYNVLVNRTGSSSDCRVAAVREGVTHQTTDVRGSDIEPLIISKTVYVDVVC